jgi:adenylosuccinate synthase
MYARCEPLYEEMSGWQENTAGIQNFKDLPENARAYIEKIETLTDTPVHIISTGAERDHTIIKVHPFE